jgi:hypothetical protein
MKQSDPKDDPLGGRGTVGRKAVEMGFNSDMTLFHGISRGDQEDKILDFSCWRLTTKRLPGGGQLLGIQSIECIEYSGP